MRSIGSAGSAVGMRRSMWPRVEKDIAVCTMFGALLEELRGRDTEHLYEKEWVDDLMLLGEEVGSVNREIPEQSPAERNWTKARQGMVTRFALKELVASASGREMEHMYDTDWVGNFPPMQPSQRGHSAWMRLRTKLPRSALKAMPVDKLGRHNLSDSIGQLPATTAGDREAATLPEPLAANSAAAGLDASVTGYGSIVLEAFDRAILTSGGCRGAAPATFAQEIEDDAPSMSHNEGDSTMMFNITTQRQSSFGSCGNGSRSFDLPLMVNIATKRSPRRRRPPKRSSMPGVPARSLGGGSARTWVRQERSALCCTRCLGLRRLLDCFGLWLMMSQTYRTLSVGRLYVAWHASCDLVRL